MTLERKKAAEERKRAEELKAQVCPLAPPLRLIPTQLARLPWFSLVPEKPRAYDEKPAVRRRLPIDVVCTFRLASTTISLIPIPQNSPRTPEECQMLMRLSCERYPVYCISNVCSK